MFRSVHTFSRGPKAGKTQEKGAVNTMRAPTIMLKEGDRFYQFSKLKPEDIAIDIQMKG